jgi:FHA domain-containing protein
MNIFRRARQLETAIARGMTDATKQLVGDRGMREPIELAHAILDAVEHEVQLGGRGARVFPFNTVAVSIAAPSERDRARLEPIVNGDVPLRSQIAGRLQAARCVVNGLEVTVEYVARAHKQWSDPQFGIAFTKAARQPQPQGPTEPVPNRLELTVVQGVAEHRSYAFASRRIELGRGAEVRDRRNMLIRTNHVAFSDAATPTNRSVSRQHAHIEHDPSANLFRLHDDGSVHGTSVVRNGRTLPVPCGARGVKLRPGDDIVLGEARLRVKFESPV